MARDIEEVRAKIEQVEKHCNGFCYGSCEKCPTKRKLDKLMAELKVLFEMTDMEDEEDANNSGTGN